MTWFLSVFKLILILLSVFLFTSCGIIASLGNARDRIEQAVIADLAVTADDEGSRDEAWG